MLTVIASSFAAFSFAGYNMEYVRGAGLCRVESG
jgi:hypothetical protein